MQRMTAFPTSQRVAHKEHLSPCPKLLLDGWAGEKVFLPQDEGGFTLIELLIVVSILVAVASIGWSVLYTNVDRQAEDDVARIELRRVAAALRRFHDDTGYWPGTGPFRLASIGGAVPDDEVDAVWFNSSANMTLLFERPKLDPAHPLAFLQTWDANTRRGWNGPYLPLANRRWVDTDDGANNVPAYGAGSAFPPNGVVWRWHSIPTTATGYNADSHEFPGFPRPFLFRVDGGLARVIYAGADGRFGNVTVDSTCKPTLVDTAGADNVVICP